MTKTQHNFQRLFLYYSKSKTNGPHSASKCPKGVWCWVGSTHKQTKNLQKNSSTNPHAQKHDIRAAMTHVTQNNPQSKQNTQIKAKRPTLSRHKTHTCQTKKQEHVALLATLPFGHLPACTQMPREQIHSLYFPLFFDCVFLLLLKVQRCHVSLLFMLNSF